MGECLVLESCHNGLDARCRQSYLQGIEGASSYAVHAAAFDLLSVDGGNLKTNRQIQFSEDLFLAQRYLASLKLFKVEADYFNEVGSHAQFNFFLKLRLYVQPRLLSLTIVREIEAALIFTHYPGKSG